MPTEKQVAFFVNMLDNLKDNFVKAIAIKKSEVKIVLQIIQLRSDKDNFILIDNFGRYMLKYNLVAHKVQF